MITVLKDQHVDLPSYAELCELKICWNSDNNGRAGGEQMRVNNFLKRCLEIARKDDDRCLCGGVGCNRCESQGRG